MLYDAPEMLKMREKNRSRRVDQVSKTKIDRELPASHFSQDWQRQTAMRRQAGDIYAFGMVMYEIVFRALPFPDSEDITS